MIFHWYKYIQDDSLNDNRLINVKKYREKIEKITSHDCLLESKKMKKQCAMLEEYNASSRRKAKAKLQVTIKINNSYERVKKCAINFKMVELEPCFSLNLVPASSHFICNLKKCKNILNLGNFHFLFISKSKEILNLSFGDI